MEEKKIKEKRNVIECHPELLIILDQIKDKVKEKTWNVVTPSYYEATEILAKKIKGSLVI